MGLYFGRNSRSTYDSPSAPIPPSPNPNPYRYEILRHEQIGNWLLVEIKYPDCTTYEGRKILLYFKTTLERLKRQTSIDPHFSNSNMISPFARFEPTQSGWSAAKRLATYYTED